MHRLNQCCCMHQKYGECWGRRPSKRQLIFFLVKGYVLATKRQTIYVIRWHWTLSFVYREHHVSPRIPAKSPKSDHRKISETDADYDAKDIDRNDSRNTMNLESVSRRCLESSKMSGRATSANETTFFSALKCRMIERFQQEWYSKVFSSERFATYRTFNRN